VVVVAVEVAVAENVPVMLLPVSELVCVAVAIAVRTPTCPWSVEVSREVDVEKAVALVV
jgi:hypothetical protein